MCFNLPPPTLDVRTTVNLSVFFLSPSCSDSCSRLSKKSSHKSEHQDQSVFLSVLQVQIRRFWKCKFICEATKHYKSPSLLAGISASPISVSPHSLSTSFSLLRHQPTSEQCFIVNFSQAMNCHILDMFLYC